MFSQTDGTSTATHIPFMVDPDRGANGTLITHMARANPHWKSWTDGQTELLIVFHGPHAYISPAWYDNQITVPTWNYAAVHVHGSPSLIHDPERLRPIVERLVDLHEEQTGRAWDVSQMESIMDVQLKAIAGFEIPIRKIEGKFKFNQNLSRADQQGVVRALESSTDPAHRAIVEIMRANLNKSDA